MILDYLGALLSLISTYLFIRQHAYAFVVGLMATCVNGYLYYQSGIYADAALEAFYSVTCVYGALHWKSSHPLESKYYKSLSRKQMGLLTLGVLLLFIAVRLILTTYTSSNVASLDSLTTILSVVAQMLMIYKYIETWILWGVTDLIYLTLYAQKNLDAHCVLMMIYTFMALQGFRRWSRYRLN